MNKTVTIALLLAVAALAGCVAADEVAYRRGLEYEYGWGAVRQNYASAANMYRKAAEMGHADSQARLGAMYGDGKGVPRDYAEAARWYRLAADQGDSWGQHKLAHLYEDGKGVPRDDPEAVRLMWLSAEDGIAGSQAHLGVRYEQGQGVEQDYATALKWYRKGAEGGDLIAQKGMGSLYLDGRGAERDMVKAWKWLTIALETGRNSNQTMREYFKPEIDEATRLLAEATQAMTPDETAKAEKLAAEWLERQKKAE